MQLCHGPFLYPFIIHPILPDDVAGAMWDGCVYAASKPLTGYQSTAFVLESDKGKELGQRFDQPPFLEYSDDGALAVSSERKELFSDRLEQVVNPWHTLGPIAGPSRLAEYVQHYREYVRPSISSPQAGWPTPGVYASGNAAIFREEITFKEDQKIKSLSLGTLGGSPAAFFVISGSDEKAPLFFDLGQPSKGQTIELKRGDWFGYYNTGVSNSNVFFNRGEPLRVTVGAPTVYIAAEMDGREVKKGDQYVYEIASLGFPVNVENKSPADLMRYVRYLKEPTGLMIKRGTRVDSPGLVEFVPDKRFVVEISIPKPSQRLDLTLPCRVQGLNPRWSAGLFQKQGYTKGDYGTGENRYRSLGMDWAGNAYIPLYVDYANVTHILAGHPVIAGPEGRELFIQVTKVGENPDKWHVSVNNPTDHPVKTKLQKTLDLPGMDLKIIEIMLQPGEYKVIT